MNYIWLIMFVILLIIELATVNLVTLWFIVGSIGAFITSYFTTSLLLQSTVFIILSTLSLLIMRPLIKKVNNRSIEKTNYDRIIGKIGVVTEDIKEQTVGEVKIEGKRWSAISDKEISVGKRVKILSIDGVKIKVKEMESVN